MISNIKAIVLNKLIDLMSSFIENKKKFPLTYFSQLKKEKQFCRIDSVEIEKILNGNLLDIVDVGARGGIENDFIKYRKLLNLFLFEADPQEALRLKIQDPKASVFDSIVGSDCLSNKKLNIGTRAGTSSSFEIDLSYLDFYCV
jgi:hypothetical protein